jgi:amino acid transporter
MAVTASSPEPGGTLAVPEKGLKHDAIGFSGALAIGLDSTAPAYSLASVIALIVAEVGLQTPATLLVAFIPILLTAGAYAELNRVDPDCGTTFSWVTRAFGPAVGWVSGFIVGMAGIMVIGLLAEVAAQYTYVFLGWEEPSSLAITVLAVAYVLVMAALTIRGTDLSAALQRVFVTFQVGVLAVFAVWTLVRVIAGDGGQGSVDPSLAWLNPFALESFSALAAGLLIAVFVYWGWESSVVLNEETVDGARANGRAALTATVILVLTYVLVAFAVLAWGGTERVSGFEDFTILAVFADEVLPGFLDELVVLAVLTSALAATQTTILPASRSALSMAARRAAPAGLGAIHPRYRTPHVATAVIVGIALLYYVPLKAFEEDLLTDTFTGLGILITFYYAITALACVVFFRRRLTRSPRDLLRLGIGPIVGAAILLFVLVRSFSDLTDAEASSTSGEQFAFGLGGPLVIGLGVAVLGIVLAIAWRLAGDRRFWAERPSVAPDEGATLDPVAR